MACGATLTLKRSLEFDPLHSRIAKRQRCMATSVAGQISPIRQNTPTPSPFVDVVPKLSNDQIAARIGLEIRRLQHRRRAAQCTSSPPASSISIDCLSPSQTPSSSSLQTAAATQFSLTSRTLPGAGVVAATPSRETPLLTLRQVGLVCERLLKEREDQLREEYEKVLNDKLTEQYESFLRFNHDQLNRRFGETAASYVS